MPLLTFGETLQKIRRERGLTQKKLAEKMDMTRGYIGHIEADKKFPSYPTLLKFQEVLEDKGELLEAYNKKLTTESLNK